MMLSALLRFTISSTRGEAARLRDLAVDVGAGSYPPVTDLLIQRPRQPLQRISWQQVERIDPNKRRVEVPDLAAAEPAQPAALERAVLLRRDILDALVLDLTNRSATLANDLWLSEVEGHYALRAADISAWAIVRRLSRGWLGQGADRNLLDWKHVEFLRGDPEAAREGGDYHRRVTRLQPAAIAHLVEAIPYVHAAELLALLPDELAADVLEDLAAERQLQVFEEFPTETAARLLSLMAPDAAADLAGRLPTGAAHELLERLPRQQLDRVIALLEFPEDSAGGLMTNRVVMLPATLSVGEARQAIREQLKDPDFIYYLYIVDDAASQRLCGVMTLRGLLVADDTQTIRDVMHVPWEVLDPLVPAEMAARSVVDNALAALPVVGRDGRLLGAITADAAIARIVPRALRPQMPRVFS